MFPGQLERYLDMGEIVTIAVHPIMAGQAVAAEILAVGFHEGCLDLGVARGADGLVENGVTLGMAIVTCIS